MANPLIRKLSNYVDLPEDDREALDRLAQTTKPFAAHTDLIRESDPPDGVYLILRGWAYRYKVVPDGRRQIMAYFIPGDLCDQRIFVLRRMDHCICTATSTKVAIVPPESMIDLTDSHPRVARALWWSTLVDEAITREWVLNVGQRSAPERVAHLICDLVLRLRDWPHRGHELRSSGHPGRVGGHHRDDADPCQPDASEAAQRRSDLVEGGPPRAIAYE